MSNRVFWNVETIYTSSTFTHIFYWPKTKIGDLWPEQEKKQTKKVLQYPQQTTLGTAGSLLSCYPSITRMNRNTETLPIIYGPAGICWTAARLKIYSLTIFHKMYRRPLMHPSLFFLCVLCACVFSLLASKKKIRCRCLPCMSQDISKQRSFHRFSSPPPEQRLLKITHAE